MIAVRRIATARAAAWIVGLAGVVTTAGCSLELLKSGPPYAPIVDEFRGRPSSVHMGAETELYWDVHGHPWPDISISHDIGDVEWSGAVLVAPAYTLTAVNEIGTTTATATITVVPPPDHDALEPNDTPDTATAIELDFASELLSLVPADVDWFTFTLAEPARVFVDIAALRIDSLLQAVVRVFDADLEWVALFTDGEAFWFWPEPAEPLDLAAGTYFVLVDGAGGYDRPHRRAGVYRFFVMVLP
jgi:hypothetical protein